MIADGVALIKIGDCFARVEEFYGVFVRGVLVADPAGGPRRFHSYVDAIAHWRSITKVTARSREMHCAI